MGRGSIHIVSVISTVALNYVPPVNEGARHNKLSRFLNGKAVHVDFATKPFRPRGIPA